MLDVMVTNMINKIISHETGLPTFSDHSIQTLTRRTKNFHQTNRIVRTRTFKDFSRTQYQEDILNHHKYIETLYEKDVQTITANVQQIISDSLDSQAPVKLKQISAKNQTKLSEQTRTMMVLRDTAHHRSKLTKDQEDIREYRNFKNTVNSRGGVRRSML